MKSGQATMGNASSSSWPATEATVPVCQGYGSATDDIYHTQAPVIAIIGFIAIIYNIVALCMLLHKSCRRNSTTKRYGHFSV